MTPLGRQACRAIAIVSLAALAGCSVALHGQRAMDGGARSSSTGGATRLQATSNFASASASFGTPASAGAPGARLNLSHSAAVVVLAALVAAEIVHYLNGIADTPPSRSPAPARSIAHTCSCYGYHPPSSEAASPAALR